MLQGLLKLLRQRPAPAAAETAPPCPAPPSAPGTKPERPAPVATPGEPVLLDVRTDREFAAVSLQGSVHLPLGQIEERIAELVPDRRTPLRVVCASGARSGAACQLLRQLGYDDVTNVGGLYAAAAALGRPLR
jgi:phage shock protein E